jgi:iron complex outermembrane receptor protein
MRSWQRRTYSIGSLGSHFAVGLCRLSRQLRLVMASGVCAVASGIAMADPGEAPLPAPAPPTATTDAGTAPASSGPKTDVSTSEAEAEALPVIVITAEKRKTKLEETPIAVSVFTPEVIERDRIQGLDDVALRAPSVTFVQVLKGETYISIRGTLINTPGAGWDDSVTTFIDDVPTTGVGDNSPNLYDLSSIEVLRGPQGTLFGRNVTGGAIVIHTLEPSFREMGKIEGTYGSDNLAQVRGLWTGPLIGNQLAGKLTLDIKRRDDYLNNVTLHDKTYGDTLGNGRGQLLWEPGGDLKVLFSGDFTHDLSTPKIVQLSGNIEPSQYPTLSYSSKDTNQGVNATGNSNVGGSSIRAEWDKSWGTLTSISGFRRVHDSTSRSRLGDPDNQALASTDIQNKQYTEEIHLASPSGQNFSWLGGLFYLHASKQQDDRYTFNLNHNTVNGGQFPIPVFGVAQDVNQQISNDVGALFGEAGLPIVDKVRFTLGGRGQWENKSGSSAIVPTFTPGNPFNAIYPAIFANASANYSAKWWSFTPKATLSFEPQKGVLLYATAARGYKSGGWDTSASSDFGSSSAEVSQHLGTPFQPEKVWSYELGGKYLSPGRRFQLNAAAFIADYRDMQTNQFNPQTAVFETRNAGRARAKGLELEALGTPTRWLTLGLTYTYDLARYTEYVQSLAQNNSGNRIPETPRHNIHLSAETRWSTGLLPGDFNVGGDYTYRTKVFFSDSNSEPDFILNQSKFDGVINLHAIWNSESDKWHATIFANDLTNRQPVVYATDVSGFYLTPTEASNPANKLYVVTRAPSRLIGLTLRRDL